MLTVTVEQGGLLSLSQEEMTIVQDILKNRNMSWEYLDARQKVLKLPQQYVGYIGLPARKIIIKPKHNGVTISHILRIFFFLYTAQYSDLDIPIYDVDTGNDINLIAMFEKEMIRVVHHGLPVEYVEKEEDLSYAKGALNANHTLLNVRRNKREAFRCTYDDLTKDIDINKVLFAALRKIEGYVKDSDTLYISKQFGIINYSHIPDQIVFSKNTAYCKKAVSLAYMILKDLTISSEGVSTSGESLLFNFDKVFEEFVKKVLMEYSSIGRFSYWSSSQNFAFYRVNSDLFERSYLPDLLYDYKEVRGRPIAKAILDMKNKTSQPFQNADIYQMNFYSQMLSCKKVILCYPSAERLDSIALRFDEERLSINKLYGAYINIAGNSAKEFKENIRDFIYKIENLV